MIALFSERPTYCPCCGHALKWPPNSRKEWDAHKPFKCPNCRGFTYQQAPAASLNALAQRAAAGLK